MDVSCQSSSGSNSGYLFILLLLSLLNLSNSSLLRLSAKLFLFVEMYCAKVLKLNFIDLSTRSRIRCIQCPHPEVVLLTIETTAMLSQWISNLLFLSSPDQMWTLTHTANKSKYSMLGFSCLTKPGSYCLKNHFVLKMPPKPSFSFAELSV